MEELSLNYGRARIGLTNKRFNLYRITLHRLKVSNRSHLTNLPQTYSVELGLTIHLLRLPSDTLPISSLPYRTLTTLTSCINEAADPSLN